MSFGLPNEVKSPRFRSGNKSVPAPLKLEELPDDAPSGPSSSPKRATSQTPPAPTKEWGAERVQVLCAPASGAVTPSFAVIPPHLSDNVFRSISVASTAHTNYTNYSAAHSDDSSIVSTAQAALAAASEAMRQEAVKAATARQQLEDQSRRLEAQLAATNQILQPLMSPRVQHLLHQIQSPKHFAAPQSQTTQAQFLTHGYVGGYGHSSGSCSAAPVTVRRTVCVAPPRVVSQVPVHTSTVAAAAAPKQVIPGLDATQKEDNTSSDQQQVSTSSSVGVQTSCELPSEVPAQDLALKEIAEALAFASRDLGTEGPSLEQVKQDRDCIRQAIAKGRAAGLSEEELATAEQQRRRLHNLYQDLKGQLRVYCRVRPLNSRERRIGDKEAMQVVDKSTLEVRSTGDVFEFDGIFGSSDSQADVFEDCCDLAQSAVDGQNVTVFCYGITGAGKTYTMYGTPEEDGLAQRMFGEVFAQVDVRPQANVTVMGSMMELYNNYLVDLLRLIDWQGRQSPALSLKLDRLGTVQVEGLARESAKSAEELKAVFQRGLEQRAVAENAMNAESSRSHVIFTVFLAQDVPSPQGGVERITSKLHFCDLGGCERLKKTEVEQDRDRRLEAIEINKSLSALGDVIEAIAKKRKYIPYRNHKLTQLLQDALGGSAKALMYVNCSPAQSSIKETVTALKLASRAKCIVNQPWESPTSPRRA